MDGPSPVRLVWDLLGSSYTFSSVLSALLRRRLRQVGGSRLTISQLRILKLVLLAGGTSTGRLARTLGVSRAACARAVDRLVDRNLLRPVHEGEGGACARFVVTEEGRRLLACFEGAATRALVELFGPLSPTRLRETARLLDLLSTRILEEEPRPARACRLCGPYFREDCPLRPRVGRACSYAVRPGSGPGGGGDPGEAVPPPVPLANPAAGSGDPRGGHGSGPP